MRHIVGAKGQVVIEKEIRDRLGIEPGWTTVQHIVDDHVEIYFVPPRHSRSLASILAPYALVRIPDEEAMHAAIERAHEEEASDKVERMRRQSNE